MNRSTPRNLGIVLFVLVAILVGLELADRSDAPAGVGGLLFEQLKDRINDVERITVEAAGKEPVVVERVENGWVLRNRDGYPADVSRVRDVLIALSAARIVERKTSNPERYAAIGVQDPEIEGAEGRRFTATAGAATFSVILGNGAAGSNRYVRPAEQAGSLLIDTNPDVPDAAAGWLDPQLIDIDAATLQAVSIEHADGETLRIEKSDRGETGFSVPDLPEGRELSYPTVANGIAGALNDLELEDVRRSAGLEASSVATFTSFDGLVVRATVYAGDDSRWIALEAGVTDPPLPAADAEAADDTEATDEAEPGPTQADAERDVAAEAEQINAGTRGWEFLIPDYKANQLTRRWDDILAEPSDE